MNGWRGLPLWARVVLGAYVAAFVVATISHLADLAIQGGAVYASAPLPLRVYFVALTAIDPVVAVLLARLRRAGVAAAVAVIVTDVAGNVAMTALDPAWPFPVTQSLFGVLVLATALPLWRVLGGVPGGTAPAP